jgi:DNA repair exonuclease SbcCD ATPase subunit
MDHMKLTDELRQQLMEAASWGKDEVKPRLDETTTEEVVEEKAEEAEETEEVVETEEVNEEAHVCPLCTSQLDEALEEESLLEHLDIVLGLADRLSQLNEGDDEGIEKAIDETIAELLLTTPDDDTAKE